MDNRYYSEVINEMQPFFDECAFKALDDGSFANEKKAVQIKYDEPRQMYTLSVADIDEGTIGEFKQINAWLFDDTQNARDASSVGIDFLSDLRKNMGIKVKRAANGELIDLPTVNKSGSMSVTGFSKKILDVFPSLKDEYKQHIAENGNFLYLNFFGEHLVPQLKVLLNSDNKKQIKKLFTLFNDIYVKGDRETVNVLVAILCAAGYNDSKTASVITEAIGENKHFVAAFTSFMPVFANNKKLIAALIK